MRVKLSKFVGPYPAVHYKLFVATFFSKNEKELLTVAFPVQEKNRVSPKKAFHFHLGHFKKFSL